MAVLFLREGFSGSKVLLPFDALYDYEPWKSAVEPPVVPQNPLLLDQVIVLAPWLAFAGERLRAGELPLWNPYDFAGQPLAGAYQVALYWPPNWVYFARPSWSFFAFHALLKLMLSSGCMLLFLRRLGVSTGPASVGALAFMLCGFQVVWLGHNQSAVALFLPLLLWIVERTAGHPSWRNAALFAAAIALQFAAGHAQTSAHVLLAVATWTLFRRFCEVGGARLSGRGLVQLAVGVLLGAALAAPQIAPFLEYLRESQGLVAHARGDFVARVDAPKGAVMMVAPSFYGSPVAHDYSGPLGANLNYSELAGGYVGRVVLALALAYALFFGRGATRWFWIALAALAFCAAYQIAPVYDALQAIPLFGSTKLMRLSLVLAFALATLGALGLEAVLERARAAPRARTWVSLAVFAAVALELFAFGYGYNPAVERKLALPRTPVTDFLELQVRREPPFRVLAVDNQALIANANLFYGIPLLGGYDALEPRRTSELIRQLSSDPRGEVFAKEIRWFDRDLPLGSLLGVRFLLSPTALGAPYRLALDGPCKVYENPRALPRAFLASRVESVPEERARLARLASPSFDPRTALIESAPSASPAPILDPAAPTPLPSGGAVRIARYEPELVVVEIAPEPSDADRGLQRLLVLTDTWFPDWEAHVDSVRTEVERVDHALRGVFLPPASDTTTVEFSYDPASTHDGLWISALAIVALMAMWIRGRGRA